MERKDEPSLFEWSLAMRLWLESGSNGYSVHHRNVIYDYPKGVQLVNVVRRVHTAHGLWATSTNIDGWELGRIRQMDAIS